MATADKIERLLTLLNVLVDAPRSISAEELRDQVPGYPAEDASFKRAFERDKDDLREMGVPLLVETVPGSDPPRLGYRIRKQEFELRDPGLAPEALERALAAIGKSLAKLTGKGVLTGNNVSHANNRTRRRYLPNIQQRRLYSESLGETVRVKIAVNTLRAIEKKGGIDAFLLDASAADLPPVLARVRRRLEAARKAS